MDAQRFAAACAAARGQGGRGGIGTLGEKLLHAALKYYVCPDPACHEVRVGRFVADVLWEGRITEIQTRSFSPLRPKLEALLPQFEVTVLCPIAQVKWLRMINPETGEVSQRRRSPKSGTALELYHELGRIQPCLLHPNLTLQVLLLEVEELRRPGGGRHGYQRWDWEPLALLGEVVLHTPEDYRQLLPPGLPDPFFFEQLRRASRLSEHTARRGLSSLCRAGVVERAGQEGRRALYRVSPLAGGTRADREEGERQPQAPYRAR